MKRMTKIAGLGLLTGAAVSLALPLAAVAKDGGSRWDGGHRMERQMGPAGFGGGLRGPMMTFADLDNDGNGQITEEDLQSLADARFAEADADGNGSITLDELAAQVETQMTERMAALGDDAPVAQQPKGDGPKGDGPMASGPRGDGPRDFVAPTAKQIAARAEQMAQRMIARQDADENGTLEAAELLPENGFGRMIDRVDTDDDNAISQAEFDEMQQERQARMDHRGDGKPGERGRKFNK